MLRLPSSQPNDQPRRTPALRIEGTAYTADDRPIEFGRTFVRGDRTRYFIERIVVRADTGIAADDVSTNGARARAFVEAR